MPPPPRRCRWPPTVHRLHSRRPQMHLLRSAQLLELRLIYLVAITTYCSRTQLHMKIFLLSSPFWYKKKTCKKMNSTWIFFFPYFCPFLGCRKIRAKFSWIFLRFGVKQYCIKISINLIFSLDDEWSMFDSKNVIKMRVLNGLFSLQNPQTLVIIWWNLFLKRKLAKKN